MTAAKYIGDVRPFGCMPLIAKASAQRVQLARSINPDVVGEQKVGVRFVEYPHISGRPRN